MDHSCGSGGMFVQSAKFIKAHNADPSRELSIFGQERVEETRHLCMMNLAVHALAGDIRQGNSYYDDLHESPGKFDFVMANPPFNVDKVEKERIKDDLGRFPGHENVKLVNSPLGMIPEGWQVVSLKDVCVEKKGIQTGPFGSQLHQSDYTDEGTPVVMPKDRAITRNSQLTTYNWHPLLRRRTATSARLVTYFFPS